MKPDENNNPLGQKVNYADSYDSSLLFPIARNIGRSKIFSTEDIKENNLSFKDGYDIWNCYEVSWLASSGKPEVRIVAFAVPFSSPCLVESKSLKLYLNSFNNTQFNDEQQVITTIAKDLSEAVGARVNISMYKLNDAHHHLIQPKGVSLDKLDITMNNYEIGPEFLSLDSSGKYVAEELYSDLLRSNCLVTGQPDWGTVLISYEGKKIDHEALLKYIISFRNHIEFHEQCVERIFNDITTQCSPDSLTVYARYTRRGGIDINPIRSRNPIDISIMNDYRFIRQ